MQIESAQSGSLAKTVSPASNILDPHALIHASDRDPLDVVLRRTSALIRDLQGKKIRRDVLRNIVRQWDLLSTKAQAVPPDSSNERKSLFFETLGLRKKAALSNPFIDFDTLLFAGHVEATGDFHMCDQYFGWNARNGGGLFLITGIQSGDYRLVDLLEHSTVENGRFKGQRLQGGSFLSPDLSYDARQVLFAWTNEQDKCYHIFKVNIDGTHLVQLTDGHSNYNEALATSSQNDFDPCWLPNGRIAFISERRGGYGRCHPRPVPSYTLFSMKDDGSDIVCISFHETNEWHPSVDNQGMIVYTRWDYVDRDDCIAHNLWTCYPDGRDPRAPHGNYPFPLTTLEGSGWQDGRFWRPTGEWNIRAIPNSLKYIATASGHHQHSFGHLVLIDPSIPDDNKMSQVTGITVNAAVWCDCVGPYGTAWPLSEDYYLCNKDNSIIFLDKFGGEETIFSSDQFRPVDPIPLKPRFKPPAVATATWQGERSALSDHNRATLSVLNVYTSDLPLPQGVKIGSMRIVQIFPKTSILINEPRLGYASESLGRMVLGTVPVEEDGSVYCEAPVGKEFYFQLLDEQGLAVQSMRAGTYVHPGEQLACIGCHEDKWTALPENKERMAFKRPPSELTPEAGGLEPVTFYRLVKPVFDSKCAPCHRDRGQGPDMSYGSLKDHAFWWPGEGNPYVNGDIVTPVHGGSRTIPGKFGARMSKIYNNIIGSHQDRISLSTDELRRITVWLDCNSNEFGACERVDEQRQGELVWPALDATPGNPQGIEKDRPVPQEQTFIRKRHAPENVSKPAAVTAYHGAIVLRTTGAKIHHAVIHDLRGRKIGSIGSADGISIIVPRRFTRSPCIARLRDANGVLLETISFSPR
jgi:hypothetical protein